MLYENVQIGDVVKNVTSGCLFVAEKDDLSIINLPINRDNYTFIHSKFRKMSTIMGKYKVDEIVEETETRFLFFKVKKEYKVMRSPLNGNLALTSKVPYCLSCNKPDKYVIDLLIKN